jgi:hypothetical protein
MNIHIPNENVTDKLLELEKLTRESEPLVCAVINALLGVRITQNERELAEAVGDCIKDVILPILEIRSRPTQSDIERQMRNN